MRILICDDEPEIRESLRDLLERHGHAVIEAGTLLEATRLLDSQIIELVLVDGQFPRDYRSGNVGTFGPLLCRQARAMGARTLLLSADDELVQQAHDAGFPAMPKPFDLQAVLDVIEEAVSTSRSSL